MPNAFELREARFQANPKLIGICTALVGLPLMWTPARSVTPPVEAVAATLNDIASGEEFDHVIGLHRWQELTESLD
ncbi:MAG: hypothetical protein ACI9OO_000609 [Bacteroidia bacterium]|jgi:hypothetical protein